MNLHGLDQRTLMESDVINGIVIGIVSDNSDPEGLGRVKVTFPLTPNSNVVSNWASVGSFAAGNNRGGFFLPQEGDEVLIAFLYGKISMPYVIGVVWNGIDKPPVSMEMQQNVSVIKTKSGAVIILDDTEGNEKITIQDINLNQIIINTQINQISISAKQAIEITALEGNCIIKANTISLNAVESMTLNAQTINVTGAEETNISGAMVNIN